MKEMRLRQQHTDEFNREDWKAMERTDAKLLLVLNRLWELRDQAVKAPSSGGSQ